jgi:hypothetical protein
MTDKPGSTTDKGKSSAEKAAEKSSSKASDIVDRP